MQINTAVMSGVAAGDTVLTTVGSDKMKATFVLLQAENYKHDGQAKVKYHRIQVECWGALAEMAGTWIGKGKQVCVHGKIECQSWKDKTTDVWQNKVVIKALSIDLLGPKKPAGLDEEGEF